MVVAAVISLLMFDAWAMLSDKFNREFWIPERYTAGFVYVCIVLFGFLALAVTPFIKRWFFRVPLLAVFAASYIIDKMMIHVSGSPLTIEMAKTIVENMAMTGDVVHGYWKIGLKVGTLPLAFLFLLALPPSKRFSLSSWAVILPLLSLASVYAVVHVTRGGATEFISPLAVPAKFATANLISLYSGPRDPVSYKGDIIPRARHVVLIVDESVRGDKLELNNNKLKNTPFLVENVRSLINFGVATASWNCSKESRVILRTGIRADQLPDKQERALRKTTIWQYAKRAGYRTIFVDGWTSEGQFHSFMNQSESADIDRRIYVERNQSSHEIDVEIARKLKNLLALPQPSFILVNKIGVHFPYDLYYPADRYVDIGAIASETTEEDKLLSSYSKAISWAVDHFFESLLSDANLDNSVLIYTSDHGQALADGGYKMTHCSKSDVVEGEGLVPIFLWTGNEELSSLLAASAERGQDRMTHFQIFPSLLYFLGYNRNWVKSKYGPDLLSTPPSKRSFWVGDLFGNIRGSRQIIVDGN